MSRGKKTKKEKEFTSVISFLPFLIMETLEIFPYGNNVSRRRFLEGSTEGWIKRYPRRKISVSWRRGLVVGPHARPVEGITKQIKKHFGCRMYWLPRRKRKPPGMRRHGIRVDQELKAFADGKAIFSSLKEIESKRIIWHLAKTRKITLLKGGELVTNFQKNIDVPFSGTEIDLIGYDHQNKRYTVIEVKLTSYSLHEIELEDKQSRKDILSHFNFSHLGEYFAQLACSTFMFNHSFDTGGKVGSVLVVCGMGSKPFCRSYELVDGAVKEERFSGWIKGFT